MYCPNCSNEIQTNAKYCWNCGEDLQHIIRKADTSSHTNADTQKTASDAYLCSLCHKNDKVKKVTAVLGVEVHEVPSNSDVWWSIKKVDGRSKLVFSDLTQTQVSHLAQKLLPPEKPRLPHWGWNLLPFLWVIYPLVIFAPINKRRKLRILSFVIVGSIPILIAFGLEYFSLIKLESDNWWFVPITIAGIPGILAVLTYLLGLEERMKEVKANEFPIWEKAMGKWDKLYYCERNDCVFDPTTGESQPAGKMKELLYS